MKYILCAVTLLLCAPQADAQLTIKVRDSSTGTPAGVAMYVAGSFNNWNPASAEFKLRRQDDGAYTITLPDTLRGAVEFKFTLGSWHAVELSADGDDVANRTFTIPATGASTYSAVVPRWRDPNTVVKPAASASRSVSVLDSAFAMPQLGRSRRVWIYLPPDYATTSRRYPVLYMHDGQNLFDAALSFSGEWGVDETLDSLHARGDRGVIVVGIDNGGTRRLDEYSPWRNARYGGGEGDAYLDFLVKTLKPYIDEHCRTLPDRAHTAIAGSSMGGLISLYAALKYPTVFGSAGVFSPALWFAPDIYAYARAFKPNVPRPRLYFVSGALEGQTGEAAAVYMRDQQRMIDTLAAAGFPIDGNVKSLVQPDGRHAEWFWRREFPAAYRWLIGGSQPVIDATEQPQSPETGFLKLGTHRSPDGHTIDANSRYLVRDGKPWLPVMGEFHYARYPAAYWEEELAKMKAGGVQIVASYIFWIHHEEAEGQFDWSGQRDLRRFVELCAKHGLLFYARVGPWSHGEARNGGFPDWLVKKIGPALRSNDSTYLSYVDRFYEQIGAQLRGLLWQDGGPIIGVQLENEYNGRGELRGEQHVLALKKLVLKAGMDVPLYSVTGWDNAVLPPAEVIPVFGGYPDWPWDQSIELLPPGEVYAFRFANRWAGNMGEVQPTSQQALARYPFLGAEYGGGIQITYHRRPVIAANDIAAMLPVQLGSGVNLYGYYMFHGGTNPSGTLTTLQESQRTGYPTDVPVRSYDFQTLLSEFGVMRESFRKTRLVHYFLNEFGAELAPMVVRKPSVVPANPADTTVLRLSARTLGRRGYLFVNNYLRDYAMPVRKDVQVTVRLPGETLRIPSMPIDIPAGAYFIWPINLDLHGANLAYSTAQLLTRVSQRDTTTYFFLKVPGIAAEFGFDAANVAAIDAPFSTELTRGGNRIYVYGVKPGNAVAVTLRTRTGKTVRIVVLSQEQAEHAFVVDIGGARHVLITPQDVFVDQDRIHLRSTGEPHFTLAAYPSFGRPPASLRASGAEGIFERYIANTTRRQLSVPVQQVRAADTMPPVPLFNAVTWRKVAIALAPGDSAFEHAARWRLDIQRTALDSVNDIFLDISYVGDVARLYAGDELLADNFYNRTTWRVGLKRFAEAIRRGTLELRILPLRSDAPIFLQPGTSPDHSGPERFPASGQIAELRSLRVYPEYELIVQLRRRNR